MFKQKLALDRTLKSSSEKTNALQHEEEYEENQEELRKEEMKGRFPDGEKRKKTQN